MSRSVLTHSPRQAAASLIFDVGQNMHFLPLLGKHLKDDVVLDVLESEDIDVIYDFDRLHENTPDKYWASFTRLGFQLRFDPSQILDIIFLYAIPLEGFAPVERIDCDVPFFSSVAEAEAYGAQRGARITKGKSKLLGVSRIWARLEFAQHRMHYEFRDGSLAVVTLALNR